MRLGNRTYRIFSWDISSVSDEDPVRLGMQIAFGRVRRKTAPTGACRVQCGFLTAPTGLGV